MAGSSSYPGALDDFSALSPTNLGDNDSTGRNHGERHDDLEAAVEAVQAELGVNPAGTAATVVARLDALPTLSDATPAAPGTAAAGTALSASRADHVHDEQDLSGYVANSVVTAKGQIIGASASGTPVAVPAASADGQLLVSDSTQTSGVAFSDTMQGSKTITSTSATVFTVQSDGDAPTLVVERLADNSGSGRIHLIKSRGSSASQVAVNDNDDLGLLRFFGYDGSGDAEAARISVEVDGTPGASDMPGRLMFHTTPDGSSSPTERMRIDNAGLITGTGTSLGAWTAYTPTLGGTGWAIGNGTATGYYCQIGKVVHVRAVITFGSTSTFGAGARPTISLPVSGRSGQVGQHIIPANGIDSSLGQYHTCWAAFLNVITIEFWVTGTPMTSVLAAAPFTWGDGDSIRFAGTYEAA